MVHFNQGIFNRKNDEDEEDQPTLKTSIKQAQPPNLYNWQEVARDKYNQKYSGINYAPKKRGERKSIDPMLELISNFLSVAIGTNS